MNIIPENLSLPHEDDNEELSNVLGGTRPEFSPQKLAESKKQVHFATKDSEVTRDKNVTDRGTIKPNPLADTSSEEQVIADGNVNPDFSESPEVPEDEKNDEIYDKSLGDVFTDFLKMPSMRKLLRFAGCAYAILLEILWIVTSHPTT